MAGELKKSTLRALSWSFLERFGQQGIQFVTSIFLARLLLPEEFGLVAMLSIFLAFGQAFINSGFQQALIQKKKSTFIDECSIFYFNVLIATLIALILFLTAPLVGSFYDQPQLVSITRVLSLVFLFSSLGLIQQTLLQKKLNFKTIFKVSVIASIISGIGSVIMALNGFGVWSLITLNVGQSLVYTIFLWFVSRWRPALLFSLNSLKSMFVFGSRLFIISLTNSIFKNIYQVVIGKIFSPTDLGFYSRAISLNNYPVTILNSVVGQVSFPVFSKIQDDKVRLKNAINKSLIMLTLITFPLMIGLATVAKPLVLILLTEKWLPCVPYLQLLCIIGMLYPIQAINLNALNAQGRSDLHLKLDITNKILIIISIAITFRFGITAMIYGQIINSFIAYYLYAYYTGKLLRYTITMQIKDMLPGFSIALVMGILVFLVGQLPISSQLSILSIQIVSGIIIYTILCYIFKISAFLEVINLVKMIKIRNIYKDF